MVLVILVVFVVFLVGILLTVFLFALIKIIGEYMLGFMK